MGWAGVAAAIIAAANDVLYLAIIATQSDSASQFLRVPFIAAFIAVMAICAALSSMASAGRWGSFLLGVSAAGLLLLGFLAMFSIGLPLVIAGVLAALGLIKTLGDVRSSGERSARAAVATAAGGAVLAVVVLLAGVSFTELAVRCPANGQESGSGFSLLGGAYQYRCDHGVLTISH